jgi:hypothetical protein
LPERVLFVKVSGLEKLKMAPPEDVALPDAELPEKVVVLIVAVP